MLITEHMYYLAYSKWGQWLNLKSCANRVLIPHPHFCTTLECTLDFGFVSCYNQNSNFVVGRRGLVGLFVMYKSVTDVAGYHCQNMKMCNE